MRPARAWIGLGVIALVTAAAERPANAQASRSVEMHAGYTKLLRFDRSISAVAIGNPEIADAVVSTDRSLLLTGKAAGTTNLIVLDSTGGDVMNSTLVVTPNRKSDGGVSVNSGKDLHGHHVYRCSPVCMLVGKVTPPRSAPVAEQTPAQQAAAQRDGGRAAAETSPQRPAEP